MTDRQPSWADLNVAPASKPSKLKIAGIGCGGLFGAVVLLGVIGNLIGPQKTNPTAQHPVPVAPATTAARAAPTTVATTPSSNPVRITPTRTTAPRKPTAAAPGTDLVFSGGLSGSTKKAVDILPTKTGADYSYIAPEGSTQCVMPADNGSWAAQVTFQVNGIGWEVQIGASGFGVPNPGSHPALPQELTGGSGDDPNAVSIWVGSDKSPDNVVNGSGIGRFDVSYYVPQDHNNGAGTVTVNPGLTSGKLDLWLTPAQPDNLEFHLTGSWSCA